jgi:hypothetical protein
VYIRVHRWLFVCHLVGERMPNDDNGAQEFEEDPGLEESEEIVLEEYEESGESTGSAKIPAKPTNSTRRTEGDQIGRKDAEQLAYEAEARPRATRRANVTRAKILNMAAIDNQCMICGWSFMWSGGDRTLLGNTLYLIEKIYVSLTNASYLRLFSSFEACHTLHKHSRDGIKLLLRTQGPLPANYKGAWFSSNSQFLPVNEHFRRFQDRILLMCLLPIIHPAPDESVAPVAPPRSAPKADRDEHRTKQSAHTAKVLADQEKATLKIAQAQDDFQEHFLRTNTQTMIDNITNQVFYTLESALALRDTCLGVSPETGEATDDDRKWLDDRLWHLSDEITLADFANHYEHLTHSACEDCNLMETMRFTYDTTILAICGIIKSEIPMLKERKVKMKLNITDRLEILKRNGFDETDVNEYSTSDYRSVVHTVKHELMHYLRIQVLKRVKYRYRLSVHEAYSSYERHDRFIISFITHLVAMNLQAVSACMEDAMTLDPPPMKQGQQKSISRRHIYKSYASFSSSVIMHSCVKMSVTIATKTCAGEDLVAPLSSPDDNVVNDVDNPIVVQASHLGQPVVMTAVPSNTTVTRSRSAVRGGKSRAMSRTRSQSRNVDPIANGPPAVPAAGGPGGAAAPAVNGASTRARSRSRGRNAAAAGPPAAGGSGGAAVGPPAADGSGGAAAPAAGGSGGAALPAADGSGGAAAPAAGGSGGAALPAADGFGGAAVGPPAADGSSGAAAPAADGSGEAAAAAARRDEDIAIEAAVDESVRNKNPHIPIHTRPRVKNLFYPLVAMSMDQFWKYLVVECAEYGFAGVPGPRADPGGENRNAEFMTNIQNLVPPRPRENLTVFDFFFGKGGSLEPLQTNENVNVWMENFQVYLKSMSDNMTARMMDSTGVAMHMFALGDRARSDPDIFRERIKDFPFHLKRYGTYFRDDVQDPAEWTPQPDGSYNRIYGNKHDGIRGQTAVNMEHPPPEKVLDIFDAMYVGLLSHVEARRNIESITSSTKITPLSSPGDWCLSMRSVNHTDAVLKMLRLPLLLNGMVTDHVRKAVRYLVAQLLAQKDPLEIVV